MGKTKKKLSDIKDALLAKASYIKKDEEKIEPAHINENSIEIEKQVFSKIKVLAQLYGKNPGDVINEALSHYLRLKKLDIDEALKNIVIGSENDD
jgi:hypothetical protein